MTHPIIWAAGALVTVTLLGNAAAGLSTKLKAAKPASASTALAQPAPASHDGVVTVQADFQGHFQVHPQVNGQTLKMMVDTGASIVALRAEDAAAAGYRPSPSDFKRPMSTANGLVMGAPVRIREMRLGDILVRDVEAVVMPAGRLGTNLLGMSFLRRLQSFDMARGRLTMKG